MIRYAHDDENAYRGTLDPTTLSPFIDIYQVETKSIGDSGVEVIISEPQLISFEKECELKFIYVLNYSTYTHLKTFLERYKSIVCTPNILQYVDSVIDEIRRKILYECVYGSINDQMVASQYADKLYKVVSMDNKSMHGGNYTWQLREAAPIIEDAEIYKSGYHLTTDPIAWADRRCRIYKADGIQLVDIDRDKVCFKSAILTEELSAPYILRMQYLTQTGIYASEAIIRACREYEIRLENLTIPMINWYKNTFGLNQTLVNDLKCYI